MKKGKRIPTVLTEEEVNRLFNATDDPRYDFMFKVIYYFGLRVSEALALNWKDINLKEKVINVKHGKGNKERIVPIPPQILKTLEVMKKPEGKIFPYTRDWVLKLIKRYSLKAKIEKNVHPHTLRHSYATYLYQKLGDLNAVKELLGHSDIQVTQIYTHTSTEYKKKMVEQAFK